MGLFEGLGTFDPMLETGILLAGVDPNADDGTDDGIWTAAEVSALDLRGTQLVVLSACQTGLADTPVGEGVLGLRRGFAYAGVRTLISSLWSVDDRATSALMQSFYGALAQGQSPSEAQSDGTDRPTGEEPARPWRGVAAAVGGLHCRGRLAMRPRGWLLHPTVTLRSYANLRHQSARSNSTNSGRLSLE
jgi:hypothetical protein